MPLLYRGRLSPPHGFELFSGTVAGRGFGGGDAGHSSLALRASLIGCAFFLRCQCSRGLPFGAAHATVFTASPP